MFTVSDELMPLMEGLSEAASFHCVSQPEWVFTEGMEFNYQAAQMKKKKG